MQLGDRMQAVAVDAEQAVSPHIARPNSGNIEHQVRGRPTPTQLPMSGRRHLLMLCRTYRADRQTWRAECMQPMLRRPHQSRVHGTSRWREGSRTLASMSATRATQTAATPAPRLAGSVPGVASGADRKPTTQRHRRMYRLGERLWVLLHAQSLLGDPVTPPGSASSAEDDYRRLAGRRNAS